MPPTEEENKKFIEQASEEDKTKKPEIVIEVIDENKPDEQAQKEEEVKPEGITQEQYASLAEDNKKMQEQLQQ